jgi:nitrite reductase/ring-hydroxylating ferredoxin subunit
MAKTTRVDVGDVNSFPDRGIRIVSAANREIGVVRWGDCLYAVRNICPHEAGELCKGKLEPYIQQASEWSIETDLKRPILSCPWHRWEFDVATGTALVDPTQRVATYPVEVEDGRVLVEIGGRRERAKAPTE